MYSGELQHYYYASPSSISEQLPHDCVRPRSLPCMPQTIEDDPPNDQPVSHLETPAALSPMTLHHAPPSNVIYDYDTFESFFKTICVDEKEDAIEYLKEEAEQHGFSVIVRTSKPDYVVLICSRGRRLKALKGERKRSRRFKSAITGCKWRVVLFRSENLLCKFRANTEMAHNHPMPCHGQTGGSPDRFPFLHHNALPHIVVFCSRRLLPACTNVNIRPKKLDNSWSHFLS
ncbi:hypothetical protein BDK51DRAFT_31781 [Blyttiomyces helicus]|uniref:FAR1 domain-containing protein n=1 Tax=Blyttiomyces helicus TaxID=388810 RepID=A0A4P9WQA7_9FUNG|nr:hypothetical protein BDK51DRAFT_31781 [Blyttiomyces helicus]|eukprot:RKO93046.1 hypothetical protein BDK51DRAFT_31781 [Blyttiomyces helicus]